MLKFFQKYLNELILPICLIIGFIRKEQIEKYQTAIHKPTMAGMFVLDSYIIVGICLTVISIVLRSNSYSSKTSKNIFKIAVSIIGLTIVCFSLLFLGY